VADCKWPSRACIPGAGCQKKAIAIAARRRWSKLGEWLRPRALRGALIFLETQLPPWVFSGVMQQLKVQEMQPPYHEIRWLMVRQGYVAGFLQTLEKWNGDVLVVIISGLGAEEPDNRHRRLLRPRSWLTGLRGRRGLLGHSWPPSGRFTRFIVSCATLVVRWLR
jgi:hypothetical protein